MRGALARLLEDGSRLHLHHGPIDIIAQAFGESDEITVAYRQAALRFETVLDELAAELPHLRAAYCGGLVGDVAGRMGRAVQPYTDYFVTPMAAVAGAVADEVLAAMTAGRRLEKAYANNGGDSAVFLSAGAELSVMVHERGDAGRVRLRGEDPARGVATSGWRGRSHSLGIADAVTVLSETAAQADVAATLIANAVDLPGHKAVARVPACDLSPDSDLGGRLVTVDVGALSEAEVAQALEAGRKRAEEFARRGLIVEAMLYLGGQSAFARAPMEALNAGV